MDCWCKSSGLGVEVKVRAAGILVAYPTGVHPVWKVHEAVDAPHGGPLVARDPVGLAAAWYVHTYKLDCVADFTVIELFGA